MFWKFFVSSLILTILIYTVIVQFLRKYLSISNFRGRKVPTGDGLVLVLVYVAVISYYLFFSENDLIAWQEWLLPLTILIIGLGFFGLIDDIFGGRGVGGFRGHFGELLKGNVTTGLVKAIGGGIICLIVASFISNGYVAIIVNGSLMALLANFFNLLDLRPGRALKLFLILGIVFFLFSFKSSFWVLSGIFLGSFVILFWADSSESCMLGDVGSNVLGGIIGFAIVANFNLLINAVLLILMGLVHIYTENHSISKLIDGSVLLRRLDTIGRGREPRGT